MLAPLQRGGPGAVRFMGWRWWCLLLAASASSAPFSASHLVLGTQQKKLGAHWEMKYLPGFYSMGNVGAPEPFPEVKCLKGSAASEAALDSSQGPCHCFISLTSGKLGLLSSAIPPPSWALLPC